MSAAPGRFAFESIGGASVEGVASLLGRYLTRAADGFGFENALLRIHGAVRDGRIESLELHLRADPARATEEQRDGAATALAALGLGFGLRLRGEALDLQDVDAVRAWLGAAPLPTPAEALALAQAALARGERPADRLLSLAAVDPGFDALVDALAPAGSPGEVPVGTRDRHKLAEFSMRFDGYAALGPALAGYANAARKRFREKRALPGSVAGARACLFFECRRRVHQARDPDAEEWPYLDALLEVAASG